ncbi:hypothetical protein C8R44DRAFT_781547 [Mycena epipterygia]|nr:hypothetical protein C8R44DRAFT_781547 [Mycena epipterygia]
MSLTLPVEAMARLQVSFKVLLPDGRLSFDMTSSPTPCYTRASGMKLHFQGTHDAETGGVTFTIWASESGHPEMNSIDEDCSSVQDSDISHAQHSNNHSLNCTWFLSWAQFRTLTPCAFAKTADSLDTLSVQAPAIPPSIFPSLGDSPSMVDVLYADNIGLDSETPSIVGSVNNSKEPFTDIFHDHSLFKPGWGGPFLEAHRENSLSQYSDPAYITEITRSEPPSIEPRPTTLPSTYNAASSMDAESPTLSVDADPSSTVALDATIAPSPSPSESLHHDSPSSSFDRSRPYKCLQADCPLWFKREHTRRVHMTVHLPRTVKDRKFPCTFDGCSIMFSRKHDRLRHEVANHGISTQWNCNPCNKYFSSQNTLERHLLDKHDSPGC